MPHDPERLAERADRLDPLLDDHDAEAVWFLEPNGAAWLTGADTVVARGGGTGVAAAGYVRDGAAADEPPAGAPGGVRVVTTNIEANRLRDEEVPDGVPVEAVDWFEESLTAAVARRSPTPALADVRIDAPGFSTVAPSTVRQPLSAADVAAYRELARTVAAAVESVCRDLDPGDTEREAAAALRVALFAEGIECPVALVGGGERAPRYRHYTPQPVALGDYALLSVTAERAGQHVSCTRTVAFDPPAWLDDRHHAAARVETAALAATHEAARDGGTAADVFDAIRSAYDDAGWEGEWRNHHQGGAAGYAGREWKATPAGTEPVRVPMAYAYNPTVQGAKSEGTALVRGPGGEAPIDVLSDTGAWPTETVEAPDGTRSIERPLPLER